MIDRLVARWVRIWAGADAEALLADLSAERERRRAEGATRVAVAAWMLREMIGVGIWGVRDVAWGAARPGVALRLAARSFRHRPGAALGAVATLALGIGAGTTIFAVLHGFTRSLPVPAGDQVVQLRTRSTRGGAAVPAGGAALTTWAHDAPGLSRVGAFRTLSPVVTSENAPAFRASAAELSPEVLSLLGVAPELGRLPHAAAVDEAVEVLLGHALWTTIFEGDPGVLGREIRVDGRSAVVVGVMPERFGFPFNQSFWWTSARLGREPGVADADVALVGRLDGATPPDVISRELTARFQRARQAVDPSADPALVQVLGFTRERGEGGENAALRNLLEIVLLLVFVSCANVANLLLSRAVERAHLLTVHSALGATPGQVALQLLGESLVLSLTGGIGGLLGGAAAIRYIESTLSANWGYHWMRVALDPTVAAFTLALVVIVAIVAGIGPALRGRRLDIVAALREKVPGEIGRAAWGSRALLTLQVGLSSVALVGAVVIAGGIRRLGASEAGLPRDQILIASLTPDSARYAEAASRRELRARLLAALEGSGARDEALATGFPGFGARSSLFEIDGSTAAATEPTAVFAVTPSFFPTFNLTLIRGRLLDDRDGPDGEGTVVLSAKAADLLFAGAEPIGRGIRVAGTEEHAAGEWLRVVGVVTDFDPEARSSGLVFESIERTDPRTFYTILRSTGDARALAPAVRRAVPSVDPEITIDGVFGPGLFTLGDFLDYAQQFFRTMGLLALVGMVGAVAVALLGLYGVLAIETRRRVRETGIRMALGEGRPRVIAGVARRGLMQVGPGLVAGMAIAWFATGPFLADSVNGDPRPWIILFATALYLAAAMATVGVPALRAARVDPARVLRDE